MSVPFCRRQLLPGDFLGKSCDGPDGCGHLLAVHVGVDHCPVCELVDLAETYRGVTLPSPAHEPSEQKVTFTFAASADPERYTQAPNEHLDAKYGRLPYPRY